MKKTYLLAAVAAASIATASNAATLISAAVFGSLGQTVWATKDAPNTSTGNYTLFLQNPSLGAFLNPQDQQINLAAQNGSNFAFLAGDGYPTNNTLNSDPLYRLVLSFDNGAQLSGTYVPGTANSFVGSTPVTVGNTTLNLTEFSFTRSLADVVGPYQAIAQSGDGNDYQGNFKFTQSVAAGVVPEPANWALMVGGFGLAGAAVRRRRTTTKVVFA